MTFFDWQYHKRFVISELERLIPADSFVWYKWKAIGAELYACLTENPFDESGLEFSRYCPVEALFLWLSESSVFEPEWLADESGGYVDESGLPLPESVAPAFTAEEQLAAFGLWLVTVQLDCIGPMPDEGRNKFGFEREQIADHRHECVMLGYQALLYARRLSSGSALTADEIEKSRSMDYSRLGRAGAEKRHAPNARLREWATALYLKGQDDGAPWGSANQAAHALKDRVIAHGRTIGSSLTDSNGQRTIAEWFRKSV